MLQGTTNDQQLRVVNSGAGSRAFGIGIHTDTTRPPLAVNSHVKVANLNTDLLDGVDSAALQRRVTGHCPNRTAIRQITVGRLRALHDDCDRADPRGHPVEHERQSTASRRPV